MNKLNTVLKGALIFCFLNILGNKVQAQCNGLNSLYQTFGSNGQAYVKRYNKYIKTFVIVDSLPGAVAGSATRSTYNTATGYLYSIGVPTSNIMQVYDVANGYALVGEITLTGITDPINGFNMFSYGNVVGFINGSAPAQVICSFDATTITSYPATKAITEVTLSAPVQISLDYTLIGTKVIGVTTNTSTNVTTFNEIDLNTGNVISKVLTLDYSLDGIPNSGAQWGATWADVNGTFYAFNNLTGGIYRLLDPLNPSSVTFQKVFISEPSSFNDGFGCELLGDISIITEPDVNVTNVNVPINGNVETNDKVPSGSLYGTPTPISGNPAGGVITMNTDGSYTFISPNPGIYYYDVPVCSPGITSNCPTERLTITVLDPTSSTNAPVANIDLGITTTTTPVVLNTLSNDASGNISTTLNPSSVTITGQPNHGTATVNPTTGEVTYTANTGFEGLDTLTYQVCDNSTPTALCTTSQQIINVLPLHATNVSPLASDDYSTTNGTVPVSGNAILNDTDPEGNGLSATPQTTTIPGKGTLVLNTNGSYTFTAVPGFTGHIEFPYTVCDNGTPVECVDATIHILVNDGIETEPDLNVTFVNYPLTGNVNTNDSVEVGTTYGTPTPISGNPTGGVITMNTHGTYTFSSPNPGVYYYDVPVCDSGVTVNCPTERLTITVLDANGTSNLPIANIDLGITTTTTPVELNTLSNDASGNTNITLNPASVTVTDQPNNGTVTVNPTTGKITYTANAGFEGYDTLTYQVCDNSLPTPLCATSQQIITVLPLHANNVSPLASDDYSSTTGTFPVSNNAITNDTDPEGNGLTATPQTTTIAGKGTLILIANGNYTFTAVPGFAGPVEFPYTVCDNGTPIECVDATIHILVSPLCATANAGPDRTSFCGNVTDKLTGLPSGGTWTALGSNPIGATLGSTNSNGISNLSFASGITGIYYFVYTNGSCADTIIINVTCAPAFNCNDKAYLFKANGGTAPTAMYSIDLATGIESLVALNISPSNINGVGYNVKDNYVWGALSARTDTLVRIGSDGSVDYLYLPGVIQSNAGDIDANGVMFSRITGNIIKRYDLDPNSPTYLDTLSSFSLGALPGGISFFDFAFNPIDNFLYAVNNNGQILKIDYLNSIVTVVPNIGLAMPGSLYGAIYFDNTGNMYASNNSNGNLYKIVNLTSAPEVILAGAGTPAANNDGARCTNACVKPEAGTDKSGVIGTTFTMDAEKTNTGVWSALPTNPSTTTFASTTEANSAVSGFTALGTYGFVWSVAGGCKDTVLINIGFATPIILQNFEVRNNNCNVILNWSTNLEKSILYYEVYRNEVKSTSYEKLASLNPIGNEASLNSYQWVDSKVPNGIYHYKLAIVDLDGRSYELDTKSLNVNCEGDHLMTIYPNPTSDFFKLEFDVNLTDSYSFVITDMLGQIVYENNLFLEQGNLESLEISVRDLAVGTYNLQVKNSLQTKTFRIIKN